jgi:signal transduction histidine kinase
VELDPQKIDLNQTVNRVVEAMSAVVFDHGVKIEIKDLPTTWGDPTAIEQIFANLIGNAVNYLDPKRPGQIEIGSLPADDKNTATYYVKDNGLGIAEAYHGKVFQALKRLHPNVAKGEGIGLALVKRMVDRHGGTIWFESTAGVGTTFYVTLPRQGTTRNRPTEPVNLPSQTGTPYESQTH